MPWIATTIKKLIRKTSNELQPPVFSFKRTQESAVHNIKILKTFNGNLSEALKYHQVIPVDYGSEFREPTRIENLFQHHDDRDKIMDIIQKGSQYYLS